jgi:flagellar hook-length control protein FliK
MQFSEKLLSYFPALRAVNSNIQRRSSKAPLTGSPLSTGETFQKIQSQVNDSQKPTLKKKSEPLRAQSQHSNHGVKAVTVDVVSRKNPTRSLAPDAVNNNNSGSIHRLGTELSSVRNNVSVDTRARLPINVPDSFISLHEHSSEAWAAETVGIPSEFMNELASIVSFTTLAAAPPSADEAGVIVSIPTNELTEDSLDSLNKLLAKHGVVTTGFLRDERATSLTAGEQSEAEDISSGMSAQAIESALILGVHIPLAMNTSAKAESSLDTDSAVETMNSSMAKSTPVQAADVLSNPALTDLLAMPVPNSVSSTKEQASQLLQQMETLTSPEEYREPLAPWDAAESQNSVQVSTASETMAKRGIQGLSARVHAGDVVVQNSATSSARVLANHLPTDIMQPVELTVNVNAAAEVLDAMTPTLPAKHSSATAMKTETSPSTLEDSSGDRAIPSVVPGAVFEGSSSASGDQSGSENSSRSATDDSTHLLMKAPHAEGMSESPTSTNEPAASLKHAAAPSDTPVNATTVGALPAATDTPLLRGVFNAPKTDSRVFRVVMERFVPQTSAIVSNLVEQSQNTARLILTPDSLGTIVVNLAMQEKEGTLHLEVSNSSTRALVEANMGILKEQCAAQGVNFGQVTVSVREQEASFGRFEQSGQQARQQRREDQESRTAFARGSHSETAGRNSKDERSETPSRQRGGGRQTMSGDSKFERYA